MTNPLIQLNRRSLQGVFTLLSLTSAILISPVAIAQQWVRVKTDADNNAYHVNVSTIEGRGRLRYFWANVIYGEPDTNIVPGKQVYSATYYIAVDCQNQIYQVRFERLLDANGQTVKDYNYGEDGRGGVPDSGSPEEASLKFVCSK
ncbi:surface-adhesin E family protein [Coleofasciculus sp. G2-EDA-02]|uniref:surface-adhesin E family protein n=1 Tax=Coleofasciculus sp. G2-EDA-02 TaxID=3069529 RepID=UPI003304C1B2